MTEETQDDVVTTDDQGEMTTRERKLAKQWVKGVKDRRLYTLVDPFTDTGGEGVGLNLLVGGTIICGRVCSAKEWAEALNDLSEKHVGKRSEIFTGWTSEFGKFSDQQRIAIEKEETDRSDEDLEAIWAYSEYMYLLGAYVLTQNGAMIPTGGQPYRIHLKDVQAWGFGTLSVGQSQD